MKFETVIGLEVHAELNTKSKIFCGCSTAFGGEPNTRVCPVCSGQPGTLPYLNETVVEYAVKLGLVLGCTINNNCKFDRKNYFYPDLPKAYQISQLYIPICTNGSLEIVIGNQKRAIGIREIHMEEDAGKLIHAPFGGATYIDLNRAGVPLLEIVTNPDFRSEEEVAAYIERLSEIMRYLGICDCKMQEGSLRVDINLSVRETGCELGTRTETKNLNSVKAIARAIKYERERQIKILEAGGKVAQQTRRWDDDRCESYALRSKENSQDYRYFPEPDLQPLKISDARIKEIKDSIPELAHQKRERYIRENGISAYAAEIICANKNIAKLFEDIIEKSGEPQEAANLVTGEIMHLINNKNADIDALILDAEKLAYLVSLVVKGKINRGAYKETVGEVFASNTDPEKYITEKGLFIINDDSAVMEAVSYIISNNVSAVGDFMDGKEKAFGFLMGQVMKRLGGKGDPSSVKRILLETLRREDNAH